MARPRKYNLNVPGLYFSLNAETNRIYWKYKHPITGKYHGLGTDADKAKKIATEVNHRLSEQRLKRTLVEYDKIIRKAGGSITVTTWLDKYLKIQQERVEQKEISHHIVKQRQAPINAMRQVLGRLHDKPALNSS